MARRGAGKKGTCGAHTMEDLKDLRIGDYEGYRRDDRQNKLGYEKIAKYCYHCGKIV